MKFLGSTILFFIFVVNIYGAQATLSQNKIIAGDKVVLILSAQGENIEFPQIDAIGDFAIVGTGTQQNIEYINGSVKKRIEKQYAFLPTKNLDIPQYQVIVDGKKELTKALHVEVSNATLANSPFSLEMRVLKTNLMQFEGVPIEFIFKREASVDVKDLRFEPPKFENFWLKEGKKSKSETKDGYVIHKINFFIFPQKAGDFELSPARVDAGVISQSRDIFNMLSNQLNWKSVFSNTIKLHVEPLDGAHLYGNFDINATIDKVTINENEGVNLIVKITGIGNFDDIEPFTFSMEGANIYADKPTVKTFLQEDSVGGEFLQKFSISSSKDFTIPEIKLTYFDSKEKKLITKTTKPLHVKVNVTKKEKDILIKPEKEIMLEKSNDNSIEIIVAFFAGLLFAVLLGVIAYYSKVKKFQLPKFKNEKDLLKALLKYRGKSAEIDEHIKILEENLYAKGKHKVNTKEIKKLIKFYEE